MSNRQRHSNPVESKKTETQLTISRFLSVVSTSNNSDVNLTNSPRNHVRTFSRVSRLSDIKNTDALSTLHSKHDYNDIIELRSHHTHPRLSSEESTIITINVSGDRFQTRLSTLQLYPETLLGNENKRKRFFNSQTKEYFFDRHRSCFEAILYYYQSHGRLRRPEYVPLDTFLEEVAFFELDEEEVKEVHQAENVKVVKKHPMPKTLWRRYIWYYFEYPQHSTIARIISLTSIFFTLLSCISLAVESLPQYTDNSEDVCKLEANLSSNSSYVPRCSKLFTSPFFIIQTICVAFFTIEFLLRLISTPSYCRFLFSFYNWVDLAAIVPYYVFLSIELANQHIGLDTSAVVSIRILRILRFSRLIKIYLVFGRLKSLRVLSATIRESFIDFIIFITILTVLAFLFGAVTYYAEQGANGDVFDSIPKAIYWGIITITGVGYGDMCPITPGGRIVTCLCALFGSATTGMLISVLVDRYQRVYNRKMYVTEKDVVNVDIIENDDHENKSHTSSPKARRSLRLSSAIIKRLSPLQERIKTDRYHICISINEDLHDDNLSKQFVTTMKKKLMEAIDTMNINVDLKLVDHEDTELWTISSAKSKKQTRVEAF